MKRPAVTLAVVYGCGLLVAEWSRPPLVLLFVASGLLILCALAFSNATRWVLWPVVFFAGWTNHVARTAIVSPYDLRVTQGMAPEIVSVRGRLIETPSQRAYVKQEREISRTLALVEAERVRHGTNWQPSFGRVLVVTPGFLSEDFFAGQNVEITGVLLLPPGLQAEGLFDYQKYLSRQSIYYQLKADSAKDWSLLSANRAPPLSDRFLLWAQATLAEGLPVRDEPLELLWAMTLGWKTGLTNEIYEPFMRSGTMHIFAISGLHIALIAGILVAVLRVARVDRSWCGVLVIPLIWFYTGVTGWQPSAIRSAIMMSIVIGGWSLRRPANLLNSLAASALIILVWDPQQLFGASFQLSFFCVLSLGLLLPIFERVCDHILSPDEFLPEQLVPVWRKRLNRPLRWLLLTFATSLAAWLGSLPLTAYYFHLFSPVTLLANLLIVPLSSVALCCNVGSLICGSWASCCSELFNHSAWFWMDCMIHLSHWAAIVPGSFLYVASPSVATMVLYYVLLAGILSGWLLRPNWRVWTAGGMAVLGLAWACNWATSRHSARMCVLPANGGLCVFVRQPGVASTLLIDPGNTNSVDLVVKNYLRAQGVNHLAALALTHGDIRHVGGAVFLADLFSIHRVYTSKVRFRSPVYRRVVGQLAMDSKRLHTVSADDSLAQWDVLHPGAEERFAVADDNSMVLRGTLCGTRILLVSDLGSKGQNALLQRGADLKADIVVTGIPTGGEPLSDDFLEAVQPRLILVGDSDYPASERASPGLVQRLAQKRIPVLYTRSAGATTIEFHRGRWRLHSVTGVDLDSKQLPSGARFPAAAPAKAL